MTGMMSETDRTAARDAWVRNVEGLVSDVTRWCKARNWPTRRLTRKLRDSQLGDHEAPALLIQVDFAQLLLEPITPRVAGAEGLVDLYAMPRYDDIASIIREASGWRIHAGRDWPGTGDLTSSPGRPFGEAEFDSVARQMADDAQKRPV